MLFDEALGQPASAKNDGQGKEDRQTNPGDAVQGGFSAAGTAEHRTTAGRKTPHSSPFGTVEKNQQN